ncbi:MAG: hypothetical protein J6L88_08160, partial [Clostridia bacterium]|nr:hypothetical protein [Clostridia bacterium]
YQLNPRLFQCRIDFFLKLCEKMSDENVLLDENTEQKLYELIETTKSPCEKDFIKKLLVEGATDGWKDIVKVVSKDFIVQILKVLPFGNIASTAVGYLIDVIEKT